MKLSQLTNTYAIYRATDKVTGEVLSYPVLVENRSETRGRNSIQNIGRNFTVILSGLDHHTAAFIAVRFTKALRNGLPEPDAKKLYQQVLTGEGVRRSPKKATLKPVRTIRPRKGVTIKTYLATFAETVNVRVESEVFETAE